MNSLVIPLHSDAYDGTQPYPTAAKFVKDLDNVHMNAIATSGRVRERAIKVVLMTTSRTHDLLQKCITSRNNELIASDMAM